MRRCPDDLQDPWAGIPAGELMLDHPIAMELPEGWTVLSGGSWSPPPIAGLTSFVELADDEVVVTVATRDYSRGPDCLLDEITGQGAGGRDGSTTRTDLSLRANVRVCALCDSNGAEEFFVAALVMARQENAPAGVGVEVVAAGPAGAITERLPMLWSMVSTIGFR